MGHLSTITRHRHQVLRHCIKAGIPLRGFLHDLSKYSPAELIPGIKYFQGNRSPNEKQRELFGYSAAWLHHKGRNKHHFEYWFDVNPKTKRYEPIKMPTVYLAEMFCDRIAASKIYRGKNYKDSDALEYFLAVRERDKMHPETERELEALFRLLAEEGEDAAFARVRSMVKDEKSKKQE